MANERRPKGEGDDGVVNELAATELSGETSGPRAPGRSLEARAVGRFRLDAQLGSGGMGDVFRAYDPVLDRAVALKVLRSGSDDSQRMRRVVREARAAAALTHPNTVTVFEVGEADDDVFIAMELLEGEDLRAVIERGSASLHDKLRWLLQAARALAAAHERGLVHRDVKPENMFVCKDGTLKLLDFGIAKREEDEGGGGLAADIVGPSSLRTQEGRRLGTPRYMAPEQLAGQATDPRTDEYAWGLVAFELLTGSDRVASMTTVTKEAVTNDGGGASGTLPALASGADRATALRAKVLDLPEPIVLAVARALEPRKEDRFPSMGPIVAAFDLTPDSVRSQRPGSSPRRRVRAWIALGVAALAATGGVFTARRAKRAAPVAALGPLRPAPACRVESTQVVPLGPDDRMAILPDGAVVLARDIHRGIFLERQTPGGTVPILRTVFAAALAGTYKGVELDGTTYADAPAISLLFEQVSTDALLCVWTEKNGANNQRIPGPVEKLVTTRRGEDTLALVTTPIAPPRTRKDLPTGVEIWRIGPRGAAYTTARSESDRRRRRRTKIRESSKVCRG